MTRRLFGTDGIRGRANTHPMTAEVAMRLGQAAVSSAVARTRAAVRRDRRLGHQLGVRAAVHRQAGGAVGAVPVALRDETGRKPPTLTPETN